jgi:hypothetical protein
MSVHAIAPPSKPWWKFFYVWLVIAGPLSVVLASGITLWFVLNSPNPLVSDDAPQEMTVQQIRAITDRSLAPALTGRNHAASPTLPGARPCPTDAASTTSGQRGQTC